LLKYGIQIPENDRIRGFESLKNYIFKCKWNPKKNAKLAVSFQNAYPGSTFSVINRENFPDFLQPEGEPGT